MARHDVFCFLPFRYVAGDAVHQTGVDVGPRRPFEPAIRAVGAPIAILEVDQVLTGRGLCLDSGLRLLDVVRVDELDERPRLQLFEVEPQDLLPRWIELNEVAGEGRGADEVERELLLARKQLFGRDLVSPRPEERDQAHQEDGHGKADDRRRPRVLGIRKAQHRASYRHPRWLLNLKRGMPDPPRGAGSIARYSLQDTHR